MFTYWAEKRATEYYTSGIKSFATAKKFTGKKEHVLVKQNLKNLRMEHIQQGLGKSVQIFINIPEDGNASVHKLYLW